MSFQELHIKALEEQIVNLTRDCHYLISLLNSTDEIDWDSWEQGRKIKEDLERSKDFFDAIQRRQNTKNDYALQRRQEEAARIQQQRNENARKAQEYLKQKAEEERLREEERQREIKLGTPWNRKKIDNVLFGHESFYDIGKFFDYLFHPIDF